MSAHDLLLHLRHAGFRLDVVADKLLVAPASRLSDTQRTGIRDQLAELLNLLGAEYEHEREAFEERAAIMEFDGGMTRPEAEAAARTVIANERKDHADH